VTSERLFLYVVRILSESDPDPDLKTNAPAPRPTWARHEDSAPRTRTAKKLLPNPTIDLCIAQTHHSDLRKWAFYHLECKAPRCSHVSVTEIRGGTPCAHHRACVTLERDIFPFFARVMSQDTQWSRSAPVPGHICASAKGLTIGTGCLLPRAVISVLISRFDE